MFSGNVETQCARNTTYDLLSSSAVSLLSDKKKNYAVSCIKTQNERCNRVLAHMGVTAYVLSNNIIFYVQTAMLAPFGPDGFIWVVRFLVVFCVAIFVFTALRRQAVQKVEKQCHKDSDCGKDFVCQISSQYARNRCVPEGQYAPCSVLPLKECITSNAFGPSGPSPSGPSPSGPSPSDAGQDPDPDEQSFNKCACTGTMPYTCREVQYPSLQNITVTGTGCSESLEFTNRPVIMTKSGLIACPELQRVAVSGHVSPSGADVVISTPASLAACIYRLRETEAVISGSVMASPSCQINFDVDKRFDLNKSMYTIMANKKRMKIPETQPGMGWCLPDIDLDRSLECHPDTGGESVLVSSGTAIQWQCICKDPSMFTQRSTGGDCDVPGGLLCENGSFEVPLIDGPSGTFYSWKDVTVGPNKNLRNRVDVLNGRCNCPHGKTALRRDGYPPQFLCVDSTCYPGTAGPSDTCKCPTREGFGYELVDGKPECLIDPCEPYGKYNVHTELCDCKPGYESSPRIPGLNRLGVECRNVCLSNPCNVPVRSTACAAEAPDYKCTGCKCPSCNPPSTGNPMLCRDPKDTTKPYTGNKCEGIMFSSYGHQKQNRGSRCQVNDQCCGVCKTQSGTSAGGGSSGWWWFKRKDPRSTSKSAFKYCS